MKKQLFIICSFFFFALTACKQEDKISNTYIDRFYENKERFDNLVTVLKMDSFLERKYGEVIKWTKFNDSTRRKLKQLDTEEVYLFSWGQKQKQFDFRTNWRRVDTIHIYYNTLDSIETEKEYYKKDENLNEIYGLGNSWALWIERKFINTKQ